MISTLNSSAHSSANRSAIFLGITSRAHLNLDSRPNRRQFLEVYLCLSPQYTPGGTPTDAVDTTSRPQQTTVLCQKSTVYAQKESVKPETRTSQVVSRGRPSLHTPRKSVNLKSNQIWLNGLQIAHLSTRTRQQKQNHKLTRVRTLNTKQNGLHYDHCSSTSP